MKHLRLKIACYTVNISMAVVGNIPPLLFLTFRSLYGISYSLLGLLVLANFCTQLTVDLLFSFFSHKFNIPLTVKLTPALTAVGLLLFALAPWLFPNHVFLGLLLGTMVFSSAAGLSEVLISPVIAAIPAENPEREMSKLHSVYAFGVVGAILSSTLFILLVGADAWQWLMCLFLLIPLLSLLLFSTVKIPPMQTPGRVSGALQLLKSRTVWLCIGAIFLGGAAETTMAQWASGYVENALGIPKVWGDIFGAALFALMLGLGRTLYAKIGKNIEKVLTWGAIGATLCYLVAVFSPLPLLALLACGLTGFCVSMLWPGSLIVADERIPAGGVFVYAIMASGGDLGASIGPWLIGVITDAALASETLSSTAATLQLLPEQLGMRLGLLIGAIFPLLGILLYLRLWRGKKQAKRTTCRA